MPSERRRNVRARLSTPGENLESQYSFICVLLLNYTLLFNKENIHSTYLEVGNHAHAKGGQITRPQQRKAGVSPLSIFLQTVPIVFNDLAMSQVN
jgi:hypothetical protein